MSPRFPGEFIKMNHVRFREEEQGRKDGDSSRSSVRNGKRLNLVEKDSSQNRKHTS